ncbi:hypothetical protein [Neisseria dentiae]|uniref:hypothetical protein n=1 Tax=Neisseria dentiae TaxID=194197 RepID=UPI00117D4CDA|nr:hypothetical protein [Neisseria dentiae]QMT44913.1 hypothetical protein H3L92_10905 [Neisseria dentiae]
MNRAVEEGKPAADIAAAALGGAGLAKGGISLSRKMAEEAAERARAETYRSNLQDIGEWGRDKNLAPESFVYQKLPDSLTRENLQFEEFKNLTRTHMDDMTEEQVGQMKRIRDDVPMIDDNTVVTKVMPYEYLDGFMSGRNTQIGGFVARQADTGHLGSQNLKQTIDNFALDYEGSKFTEAAANGQDRYLIFEGRLTDTSEDGYLDIPMGSRFGGHHKDGLPCTLNGFVACRSDEILPEYKILKDGRYPEHRATISIVEDGIKREVLMFDEKEMRFIPMND